MKLYYGLMRLCRMCSYTVTLYQKGVYYMSIKIFNKLPEHITDSIRNKRRFITRLKQYLINKSLYSLEEFMSD